jgi:hypothetical protein
VITININKIIIQNANLPLNINQFFETFIDYYIVFLLNIFLNFN